MKRFLSKVILLSLLLAMWVPASVASAQNLNQACDIDAKSALCKENKVGGGNRIYGLLRSVANLVSLVAGVAGVVMIMIGGFRYIRGSGDPNALGEARNTILYALIGLVVAATAQILIAFVLNRLSPS